VSQLLESRLAKLKIRHRQVPAFECRIGLINEDEGGYSVFALDLPGVQSQGETVDEAVANIRDALSSALDYYVETEKRIPWKVDADVVPHWELRIVVECPSFPQ